MDKYENKAMCRACLTFLDEDEHCQKHDIFLTHDLAKKWMECTSMTPELQDGFPKYLCQCCYNKVNEFHEFQAMCFDSVNAYCEVLQRLENNFELDDDGEPNFDFEDDEEPNFDFEAQAKLEITVTESNFHVDEIEVDVLDSALPIKRRSERNMAKTKTLDVDRNPTLSIKQKNCNKSLKRSVRRDMNQGDKGIKGLNKKPKIEIDTINEDLNSDIDNDRSALTPGNIEDDKPNEQDLQQQEQQSKTCRVLRKDANERVHSSRLKGKYRKRKCERSNSKSMSSAKKSEVYQCDVCPTRFYVEHRMAAHKRTHDGLMPYPCSVEGCDKGFNRWQCFNEHLKQHEGSNQLYSCGEEGCDKVYKHKHTLSMHLRKFHKKGPELKSHVCEICGKVYKASAILNDHRYTHKDKSELPYACPEENCERRFSSKEKLKVHGMRHAGIKNYACPYCGMRKTTRNELKIHINYHTLERTWPCRFCQHVCNSAGNLKMHVRTVHERAKDYACQFCERTFAKPDTRKYHEMTHTGEKPNECKECGKRFTQPAALRTHRKIHLRHQAQAVVSKEVEQSPTESSVENAAAVTALEPTEGAPTIEAELQNLL